MSDQSKVPQEPYTAESGYSENISGGQMDPTKELGDPEHHPERHSTGYSEHGQVVDPTHNVSESANTPPHTEGSGAELGSGQGGHESHAHQRPEHHDTTYSQYISHEAHNPVEELGDAAHHPKRAETLYSQHGHVVDRTHNVEE